MEGGGKGQGVQGCWLHNKFETGLDLILFLSTTEKDADCWVLPKVSELWSVCSQNTGGADVAGTPGTEVSRGPPRACAYISPSPALGVRRNGESLPPAENAEPAFSLPGTWGELHSNRSNVIWLAYHVSMSVVSDMCTGVCLNACMCTMCVPGALRGQVRMLGPLDLKL